MKGRIYPTRALADRVRAALDAAEGYPKRGVALGPHVPPIPDEYSEGAFGWTVHAVRVLEHPTRREFAIPDTVETQRNEGRDLPVDVGPPVRLEPTDVVDLPADWFPDPGGAS